jgi:DNA-binding MarR family transcriptional regulator
MNLPTIESVTIPYLHLPKAIQRACMLVETHPTFNGITKGARRVLKAVVSYAEKTDGCCPIETRLKDIAKAAGVNRKTVTRAMHTFNEAGWLEEKSHGRGERGKFADTILILTAELCWLVGLPTPDRDDRETRLSRDLIKGLSFEKEYRDLQREKREAEPTPPPVVLPPELEQASAEFDIKDTGICKLRGMATDAGHRLEDIVACARERLLAMQAKGGRVFRYLETMIGKNSDYAARAAKIERREAIIAEATQHTDRAAKYAHKRFAAGPGTIVRIFDGTAEVSCDGRYIRTLAGPQMQQVYADIEAGTLKEIKA